VLVSGKTETRMQVFCPQIFSSTLWLSLGKNWQGLTITFFSEQITGVLVFLWFVFFFYFCHQDLCALFLFYFEGKRSRWPVSYDTGLCLSVIYLTSTWPKGKKVSGE
jgi:hypothetical protein